VTQAARQPASEVVASLRDLIRGEVVDPDHSDYEDARQVFNAAVNGRPAAIVRAADADDVAAAVKVAGEHGLAVAARGGRHSFAGLSAGHGAVVIDTRALDSIELDPESRTAWAGAGVLAGDYTKLAGEHGLATGFGDTGEVGITGLTLGGGLGYLARKHGMTIDDLLAVELVTADGELVVADEERHPDLFWALRGGGGNFGVVTRLRYRLHELPAVYGGMLMLPGSPEILRRFIEVADEAPEELTTIAMAALAPPAPFVPAEHHGQPALMVMLMYAGDPEAGEAAVKPLRELATPWVEMVKPMRYPEIYELGGEGPPRGAVAVRTRLADELSDEQLEAIYAHQQENQAPGMAGFQLRVLGGALARVPADATAYAHRAQRLMLGTVAITPGTSDDSAAEAWVESFAGQVGLAEGPAYVNYLGADAQSRLADAYPDPTLARLREVKRRYDPDNRFRWNVNIEP